MTKIRIHVRTWTASTSHDFSLPWCICTPTNSRYYKIWHTWFVQSLHLGYWYDSVVRSSLHVWHNAVHVNLTQVMSCRKLVIRVHRLLDTIKKKITLNIMIMLTILWVRAGLFLTWSEWQLRQWPWQLSPGGTGWWMEAMSSRSHQPCITTE